MKTATTKSSIITLTFVTVLFIALLAIVNVLTAPKIAENAKAQAAAAGAAPAADFGEFFGEGATYEKLGDTLFHDSSAAYFRVVKGSQQLGYAIYGFGQGYQSVIHAAIGLNTDFSIRGVKVLSQAETEGLGTLILEGEFLSRFLGKKGHELSVVTAEDTAANAIMAITAATVSSRALAEDAVKNSVLFLKRRMDGSK